MKRKGLVFGLVVLGAVVASVVAVNSFGAGGTGAVASFKLSSGKLLRSANTTPTSAWSTLVQVTLPVGSWVVNAHTVVSLASTAPGGTDVECDLIAPNAQMGYTAAGLLPSKGNNIRELSAQTVSDAPNGGTASLVCRLNSQADNKLAFAKQTSIIATSVAGTSASLLK
jgi:hypothetical protein